MVSFEEKDLEKKAHSKESRRFWIGILKDIVIFLLGLLLERHLSILDAIGF